jgi:CRISPR-associated protein Csm3
MERVPAGTVFGGTRITRQNGKALAQPAELVYSIYSGDDCNADNDIQRLRILVEGLQLLDDDYLGGLGSRGSGKIRLSNIKAVLRSASDYGNARDVGAYADLAALAGGLPDLQAKVRAELGLIAQPAA